MIPPLPQATLDANPAFARLWEHVTTQILEGDGSRRATNEERRRKWKEHQQGLSAEKNGGSAEQDGVEGQDVDTDTDDATGAEDVSIEEALEKARVARMRTDILREVLRDIAFVDGQQRYDIGEEGGLEKEYQTVRRATRQDEEEVDSSINLRRLKDTLLVISAYLDTDSSGSGFTEAELRLLADDVAVFEEKIGVIADAVGARIIEVERRMAEVAAAASWDDSNNIDIDIDIDGDADRDDIDRGRNNINADRSKMDRHSNNMVTETYAVTRYGDGLPAERRPSSSSPLPQPPPSSNHVQSRPAQSPSKQTLVSNLTARPSSDQTLISHLTAQRTHLASLTATIPTTLTTLSSSLTSLLTLHRDILSHQLRTLEATKHGVLSRWTSSRANFLASVATAMSLKTRILVLQEQNNNVEHSQSTEVVTHKMIRLDEQDTILNRRIDQLSGLLARYEALHDDPRRGVEVLRTLGRRYGEIEHEIERVREDIERLKIRRHDGR